MNALAVTPNQATSSQSFSALVPTNIEQAINLANVMAKASLIPEHLRNPGDCLLVVMQAQRWGMDAVSVAQSTSVVHGRLCYEGKLVAAVLYSMGAVEGRLHYEIKGSGQSASITVTGTPRGGTGPQSVTGCVKDWRTYGKNKQGERIENAWDKIPEDMLVYRGNRQWARRYTPEALLGVYTPDEFDEEPVSTARIVTSETKKPEPAALPAYTAEEFAEKLPMWRGLIQAGTKSADAIIAMVSSKRSLSAEQLKAIRDCDKPPAHESEKPTNGEQA